MTSLKSFFFTAVAIFFVASAFGQKHFTKEGNVSFYSEAPMEKIEAHNKRATAIVDEESGAVQFALLVKNFQFEKALMQEHFNENYMESDKYPKSTFRGTMASADDVDFSTPGTYETTVTGDLEIHGKKNTVTVPATFIIGDDGVQAKASFSVKCQDYDIKIPNVVADNIAKQIDITIDVNLQPYVK